MAYTEPCVSAHRVALDLPGSGAHQLEQPHIAPRGDLLS
jgi:hypothetical protein